LSDDDCDRLWRTYNVKLVEERQLREFPIIDFDRQGELPEQVGAALAFYGIDARNPFTFLETELVTSSVKHGDWRSEVADPEILAVWDALAGYALS
jgi:hypothetical protein